MSSASRPPSEKTPKSSHLPNSRSVRPPALVLFVLVAVAMVGVVFLIFELAPYPDLAPEPMNQTEATVELPPSETEDAGDTGDVTPSPAEANRFPAEEPRRELLPIDSEESLESLEPLETDAVSLGKLESKSAPTTNGDGEEIEVTGRLFGARFALRMEGSPDSAEITIFDEVLEVSMPGAILDFEKWLTRYLTADSEKRTALLPEGEALVQRRREALEGLFLGQPQAVLLAALTPPERAALPPAWEEHLEKWVSGVGEFEVVEIASQPLEDESTATPQRQEIHVLLEDAAFQGVVYGSRTVRISEQDASLFGIALENRIVLHEGDFVFFPSENIDPERPGKIAVLYRGQWTFIADPVALEAHLQELASSTKGNK